MKRYYYKIGDHSLEINTQTSVELLSYLPSLQPFTTETPDNLCFSLTLTEKPIPSAALQEITRFEWEGAECVISTTGNGYEVVINPAGNDSKRRMTINKDFTCATAEFYPKDSNATFVTSNFLMMLYAFATAPHSTLMVHASVIKKDEVAYLFLGKSGTGKSTHSRLWLEHIPETELLNDDNPIVRLHDDGTVKVYGSPWSGKTPCYRNIEASISAFVRIQQAPANAIYRDNPARAFASLLPSCSCLKQDKKQFDYICDTVASIASQVPVFRLECLPDKDAAELCYSIVTNQ